MYTAWKKGDRIRICAEVTDYCGAEYQILRLRSGDMQKESDPCVITCRLPDCAYECINTRGREVVFRTAGSNYEKPNDAKCSNLAAQKFYRELGRATSDTANGIATLIHTVSEQDRLDYQDAIANDLTFDILCCMNDPLVGSSALVFKGVTVSPAPEPTHRVQFKMAFVPPEIMDVFTDNITQISDGIMSRLDPLPGPWQYVRTTYDRTENAFNIWLSLPSGSATTMSAIDDIIFWISNAFLVVVGFVIIILAPWLAPSVFVLYVLYLVGVIAGSWGLYNLIEGKKVAEEIAKNLKVQKELNNNSDIGKGVLNDGWEASAKTQADCLRYRLEGYRDFHSKGYIDSYTDKYAKYSGFVTALKAEKNSFLTNVNGIIAEFKAKPYSVDLCNTYYSAIDSAITASRIRVNELVTQYIDPEQPYELTCKGYSNQSDCEKAECYWYNSECHQEEACWIPNPLGGCILSAGTGKAIVGTAALLAIVGTAYWLATRKPQEIKSIYYGAKEAAAAEAKRAKELYERVRLPAVPATAIKRIGD